MPKEEPDNDLCRCCHAEGAYKNLYESYFWRDVEEVVYCKLLRECFDIEMAPVTQQLQHVLCTICDACIERLQDAVSFKRQVLKCEKRFRDVYGSCVGEETEVKVKKEIDTDTKEVGNESNPITEVTTHTKTSVVALSCRRMDDDDDDGFSAADDDDDFKPPGTDTIEVKVEKNYSDSEDDIVLQEVAKGNKRKAKTKTKTSPAKKKTKVVKKPKTTKKGAAKDAGSDCEELDVVQGTTVFRVKNNILKNVDYTVTGNRYQCVKCPVAVNCRISIHRHIASVHLGTSKFKCPNCYEQFWRIEQLVKHKFKEHSIDDRLKCNACDKAFYKRSAYKEHVQSYHKLGERYTCDECTFETYSKSSYSKHRENHSAQKIHQCKYCKKGFKRKSTLVLHERIHTGEKRKVCTECGQAFVQRASLKYHMEKHHPGVDF